MSGTDNSSVSASANGLAKPQQDVATRVLHSKMRDGIERVASPTIDLPKNPFVEDKTSPGALKTPKTPADEGIEFFESANTGGAPIQVYELKLDPDGGPNKDRAVG